MEVEVARFPETSVNIYETTRRHMPGDTSLLSKECWDQKNKNKLRGLSPDVLKEFPNQNKYEQVQNLKKKHYSVQSIATAPSRGSNDVKTRVQQKQGRAWYCVHSGKQIGSNLLSFT